ncbi:hypothetical protein BD311DRAFT_64063 [Dichomitus squalens]|uniref:Uncharacterized protein n=1 Tax=Dichomitus squalens TaxID=114155 RepID=A0A4Q9M9C3_9APHY|nr:hypothetical protein BD311DRAFT_64063 [Dichomitus squalens]
MLQSSELLTTQAHVVRCPELGCYRENHARPPGLAGYTTSMPHRECVRTYAGVASASDHPVRLPLPPEHFAFDPCTWTEYSATATSSPILVARTIAAAEFGLGTHAVLLSFATDALVRTVSICIWGNRTSTSDALIADGSAVVEKCTHGPRPHRNEMLRCPLVRAAAHKLGYISSTFCGRPTCAHDDRRRRRHRLIRSANLAVNGSACTDWRLTS